MLVFHLLSGEMDALDWDSGGGFMSPNGSGGAFSDLAFGVLGG